VTLHVADITLLVPVLAGATCGFGTFLAVRAVRPGELTIAASRLHTSHERGQALVQAVSAVGRTRRERELAITRRTPAQHAAAQLSLALVLAGAAVASAVVAGRVGLHVQALLLVLAVVGALAAGFLLQDASLQKAARRRRRDFSHALSSYLDLVNVLLAGGAGIETALQAAAESGDGWAFRELRGTLARARTARRSVWSAFGELGESYGVDDLTELSASIQLAGQHGARVASSLAARAQAMRDRLLARIEADAQAASERMGLPTVLMFVGFLFLLGYPAVQIILGST